ncbi:MAG TPA: hypothetical protein VF800_29430 [Telluria sp.]|jgi:hypothetical protein
MNEPTPLMPDMSHVFLIEGMLTKLHVASGKENLLAQIGQNNCSKNVVTGLGATVSSLKAQAMAAAVVGIYDGEVWVRHAWGATADMWANYTIAAYCFCFSMFCVTFCILFLGVNPAVSKVATFIWSAVATGLPCFGIAWWNSATMNALADPATEVFRLLGFADPDKVNLNRYQYGIVNIHELIHTTETRANYGNIHCYKKAMEDGKLALAGLRSRAGTTWWAWP